MTNLAIDNLEAFFKKTTTSLKSALLNWRQYDHRLTIALHPSTLPAVVSPVLTPFKADGNPDAQKLLKQCKWLESNEVGQAVFGTNSEANSMSAPQKMSTSRH